MNKSFFAIILISTMYIFSSCSSDDEVSGCSDPNAQNYNPDATTSATCTYISDTYVGDYKISISDCTRAQELFNNVTAVILKDDNNPSVIELVISGVYSRFIVFETMTDNSNSLSFDSSYDSFTSTAAGAFEYNGGVFLFPTFKLMGQLDHDNGTLTGNLTISAVDADRNDAQIFSTSCNFELTKI